MHQKSVAELEYDGKRKKTRRERLLEEMEQVVFLGLRDQALRSRERLLEEMEQIVPSSSLLSLWAWNGTSP